MHPPTIKRDLKYTCIKSAFYTRCRTAKIHWRNLIGLNCPIERKSKKKKKKTQKKQQQYHLMIKCSTFCSALWAHLFNTNRSTRHKCISMRFCIFVILLNCNYICALERGNERPVIIYQLGVGRGLGYFWQIRHFFGDPPPANFYFEVDPPPTPPANNRRILFVCCLAHRGSTVGFLLLQCSSGVVRHPRDLQVSIATRFCRVCIFASS